MGVPYHRLIASVGLRLNALVGTAPTDLETTYKKTAFLAADFESADFPFTAIKDLVLQAEGKYAGIIANVGNHPWRSSLHAVTASIVPGGVIPSTSSSGDKIIGIYGSVRDASDGSPLKETSLSLVRRYRAETWRKVQLYRFAIDGTRLYHTRANATIDVCVYNAATQRALIEADQTTSMLLPDVLESAIICEAVSMAFRDDAFAAQAGSYRAYSGEQIALIQQGLTSVPAKSVPALAA
jgi:hypothetical protein